MTAGSGPTCRWPPAWSRRSSGRTRSARRDADLDRQPDGLASPRGTAGRARGLRRAAGRARHPPGRHPCRVPVQPRRPGPGALRRDRRHPGRRAAWRAVVRGTLRQRPHRLASRDAASTTGMERVAEGVRRRSPRSTTARTRRCSCWRTRSASGWGLGTNVEELAAIADAADRAGVPRHRLGFCLDTAHAWGAGIDLADPDRHRCLPRRLRRAHRARSAGHGPPQRLALGARLARSIATSTSARGGSAPVGLGHLLRHPSAGPRDVHPRDAGHGRGLRRDQPGPRARAARRPAAGRPLPPAAFTLRSAARPDGARMTGADSRPSPGSSRGSSSALLLLAALLRLPGLEARGTWDGDQGHDMLVLRAFVRDGVVPLLGPPTSIGDVHHGAWYYYLLSPAAFLTGGDSPLAVVALIAARRGSRRSASCGGWRARSAGRGPGSSPGCAGRVRRRRRRVDVHLEPEPHRPVERGRPGRDVAGLARRAAALVARRRARHRRHDAVPRPGRGDAAGRARSRCVLDARRRSAGRRWSGSGSSASSWRRYLPLAINELTTSFSEVRAALDYLAGGRDPGSAGAADPVRDRRAAGRVVAAGRADHAGVRAGRHRHGRGHRGDRLAGAGASVAA